MVKYAPGSPVEISTRLKDKNTAELVVQDKGSGIPKEKQTIIFERFERAIGSNNVSGLGLGLFITKNIVAAHKGKIQVESEPGHGSRFIIELPLSLKTKGENRAAKRAGHDH